MKSIAKSDITITNSLNEDILFQIDLEKEEFGHTSPFEIIVPSMSTSTLPLVFERNWLLTLNLIHSTAYYGKSAYLVKKCLFWEVKDFAY